MYNVVNQQRFKRQLSADQSPWPPVWVMCDGQDAEYTAFISSSLVISGNDSNENILRGFPDVDNGIGSGDKPSTNGVDILKQQFTIKTLSVNVTGWCTQ